MPSHCKLQIPAGQQSAVPAQGRRLPLLPAARPAVHAAHAASTAGRWCACGWQSRARLPGWRSQLPPPAAGPDSAQSGAMPWQCALQMGAERQLLQLGVACVTALRRQLIARLEHRSCCRIGLRTRCHVVGGQLQLHPLQLALPLQALPLPLGRCSLLPQQEGLQLAALGLQSGAAHS